MKLYTERNVRSELLAVESVHYCDLMGSKTPGGYGNSLRNGMIVGTGYRGLEETSPTSRRIPKAVMYALKGEEVL